MADDGLQRLELNLQPNEASGLLAVEDEPLLEAHGWDLGFGGLARASRGA